MSFLKSLFGSQASQELTVKLIAAETFKGKPGFARKALELMNAGLSAVNAGTVATVSALPDFFNAQMGKMNLIPEERIVMGVFIKRIDEVFCKNPITDNPLAQLSYTRGIMEWIKETAIEYAKEGK